MAGNSGQAGRRYSSTRPSLCYPSLNTQAAFRPALLSCCKLIVGTTAVGQRQLQHPVRRLDQGARLLRKSLTGSPVALLFGSEKRGLSNEDFSHCHWLLRIPTREEHRSMNLGQAVAVCLY